jgi:hypothetical protein
MSNRVYQSATLAPPVGPAIPYGQFFDIDQKYYEAQPDNETKERRLRPHGTSVNLKNAEGFISYGTPISLSTGNLKTNYGSYLFQQLTGYDAAHSADIKTPATVVFF